MFRMYGNRVEVLRYQILYTENEEQRTDYAVTKEEANSVAERVGGTVSALPPGDYEWMDGLVVPDAPDTYSEAMEIYRMGEVAYKAMLQEQQRMSMEQLRADIDFSMVMGGYV